MNAPAESWRSYFPAVAALALVGLGAWGAQLAGAPLGLLPRDHAAFMVWGLLGTGVMGFAFTAYARQNDAPLPGRGFLFGVLALQLAGALAALVGRPALLLVPWALFGGWTVRVAAPSLRRRWDDTTAGVPPLALAALVALAVHVGGGSAAPWAVQGFLVPLALTILDRVLPFFSSRVTPGYDGVRRRWFVGPLLVLSWWAAAKLPGTPLATLALLGLVARQVAGWRPWPAARTPMIAVLYLGVAWFGVGLGMAAAGVAPSLVTHALAIGGLGTSFLAISMRVVRGHGGLPLELGRAGVGILALGQLGAALRLVAVPLPWSAAAFSAAFLLWAVIFLPVCLPVRNAPRAG